MTGIVELRQTGENDWRAKYQGDYDLYTIKVTLKGKKAEKFSCTCPSDYYPCKHISYVEDAIAQKMAGKEKQKKSGGLRVEDIIGNVSAERLREFISTQVKYNDELRNAVFLEFSGSVENTKGNKYSNIIQRALASVSYDYDDYDDYYSEETQDIDVLEQWFDKAQECVDRKQYDEAILICKACVEEYSQWLFNAEEDTAMMFDIEYQSIPFEIMEEAAEHTNKRALFDYCLSEMKKNKYAKTNFYYGFHALLTNLALTVDPDAFIALQDELLADIKDKSSGDAETVLRRKIDFYRRLGQADRAWALIEENIQIKSFRQQVVEKRIEENNFLEAKKIINDLLTGQGKSEFAYSNSYWYNLLLEIAQKENDIPAIRELSYGFLKNGFDKKYYDIYKTTFGSAEWPDEFEKFFRLYDRKYFNSSVAELLKTENEKERLLHYIEKYSSVENLESYYKSFASVYPEKTIKMFQKVLIQYAEAFTGRTHYEHIVSLLKKLSRIKCGRKAALALVADFKIRYKNRRARKPALYPV